MKKLHSLFGLNVSSVTFREARLINGNPDNPTGLSKSAEVPKDKMMPLAVSLIKDIMGGKNGMSSSKFSRVKSNPAKQQAMIKAWLKTAKLQHKLEDNLMGTAKVSAYYMGNKKVNPSKVAKEIHTFLSTRKNRSAVMAAIKRERTAAKRTASSTASSAPSGKFKETGFSASSQREADKKSRTAQNFYQGIVSGRLSRAMIHSKEDASSIQAKLNATLNKYGVNVAVSLSGSRVSFSIQFNGTTAWPKISSASRRKKTKSDILKKIG
ncbi:hypothetical protein ACFL3C_01765 [Patescibacteria group bacterium]